MFLERKFRRVKLYYFNVNKVFLFCCVLSIVFFILIFPLRHSFLNLAFAFAGGPSGDPILILEDGIVGIAVEKGKAESGNKTRPAWDDLFARGIRNLTGIDTGDVRAMLCAELNILLPSRTEAVFCFEGEEGGEEDYFLPETEEELREWMIIPEDDFPPVRLNGDPMVLIYTTHNAESYKPTQGASKVDGKNGGVASVSEMFAKVLESKHSIKTIYSDVIHDYPDFTKSYVNSMQTMKKYLQEYPQIQVVLDIHRDAGLHSRSDTLVKIKGKECAKVMIVVGTEYSRYEQNLAFARKLEKKANELYPGLIKCVRLFKARRYNQNLHSRALLLEFGSDLNKEAEALESAKLMADVLAEVLKD